MYRRIHQNKLMILTEFGKDRQSSKLGFLHLNRYSEELLFAQRCQNAMALIKVLSDHWHSNKSRFTMLCASQTTKDQVTRSPQGSVLSRSGHPVLLGVCNFGNLWMFEKASLSRNNSTIIATMRREMFLEELVQLIVPRIRLKRHCINSKLQMHS